MRYNIYNTVHLPLKSALLSASVAVSNVVNREASSVKTAIEKVEEAMTTFHEQVIHEGVNILPFVFEYEPSVWSMYTSEHNQAISLCNNLRMVVQLCNKQKKEADKRETMKLVSEHLNELMLFSYNHMDDEEAVLNEILWRYYPDTILKQIEKQINVLPQLRNSQPESGLRIATAA